MFTASPERKPCSEEGNLVKLFAMLISFNIGEAEGASLRSGCSGAFPPWISRPGSARANGGGQTRPMSSGSWVGVEHLLRPPACGCGWGVSWGGAPPSCGCSVSVRTIAPFTCKSQRAEAQRRTGGRARLPWKARAWPLQPIRGETYVAESGGPPGGGPPLVVYANQAAAIRLAGRSQGTLAPPARIFHFFFLFLSFCLSLVFPKVISRLLGVGTWALEAGGYPTVLEQTAIGRTPAILCAAPSQFQRLHLGLGTPPPPIAVGPPRRSPLCAPAVPLLRLQFVLLCFRMATIEPPPQPPSPLLRSSPHPLPPSAAALRAAGEGAFVSRAGVPLC